MEKKDRTGDVLLPVILVAPVKAEPFFFPQQTRLLAAGSLLYFTREIKRQQQHVLRADTENLSSFSR